MRKALFSGPFEVAGAGFEPGPLGYESSGALATTAASQRALDQNLTTRPFPVVCCSPWRTQSQIFRRPSGMELAGLEPATSWVRSRFGVFRPVHDSSSLFTKYRFCRMFPSSAKQPFTPLCSPSRSFCAKNVVTPSCLSSQQPLHETRRQGEANTPDREPPYLSSR
jgi:hypothetical protein